MNIFERNVPGSTEILKKNTVAIAGCGGLGSNAAVALVRAGIGTLILADFDRVEASNLNRQYFFQSDIGIPKVDALTAHLKNINPDVQIEGHDKKLEPADIPALFAEADVLVEAFDNAESKVWLINAWCKTFPQRPIVIGSGLSGLGNTDALKVRKAGNLYVCGDEASEMTMGLCSARVAIAANMQANMVVEVLVNKGTAQ